MKNKGAKSDEGDKCDDGDLEVEECDMEVWNMLRKSFPQVQSVLEHNRLLIQQVNENQQSRISNNLVNNISLIHEINEALCYGVKSGENNGGRGIHE
ncbi:protein EARLY FLOWERING 4-like [Cucurbita moschata]|uniref:Protein EARLY FLOWERING 4-like n=1 Tax=Cucurbita moschata TaxID=3662 RepID=A0A6J1G8L9_CUCMO|nr:protein EARLY FLOWERING 4-like [Cucurbita moschata]